MTQWQWHEGNSNTYRQFSNAVVPHRAEQIATLISLIPFGKTESFRVVELASGEGFLAHAIMNAFPQATLLALDIEDSMRAETARRLASFGERASVAAFDMAQSDWYSHIDGADVIVSSLCVHHLDGDEKRGLFQAVADRLSPRGALLIADIIQPQRVEAIQYFAAAWDEVTRVQAADLTGSDALFQKFVDEHWNFFAYPVPGDKPSPISHQLAWLTAAGFAVVDVFWMDAGHAIYGGYKSAVGASTPISYADALTIAQLILSS